MNWKMGLVKSYHSIFFIIYLFKMEYVHRFPKKLCACSYRGQKPGRFELGMDIGSFGNLAAEVYNLKSYSADMNRLCQLLK